MSYYTKAKHYPNTVNNEWGTEISRRRFTDSQIYSPSFSLGFIKGSRFPIPILFLTAVRMAFAGTKQ